MILKGRTNNRDFEEKKIAIFKKFRNNKLTSWIIDHESVYFISEYQWHRRLKTISSTSSFREILFIIVFVFFNNPLFVSSTNN